MPDGDRRRPAGPFLVATPDGGFGHFPGSTSDADANYFQVGTLVMAGFLKPAEPLPKDPHLLSWGHLMPVTQRPAPTSQIIIPHPGWVGGVALAPGGTMLASACSDGIARLWEPKTGKELARLEGHSNALSSIAISPSGELLATGSYDQTAKLSECCYSRSPAYIARASRRRIERSLFAAGRYAGDCRRGWPHIVVGHG